MPQAKIADFRTLKPSYLEQEAFFKGGVFIQ